MLVGGVLGPADAAKNNYYPPYVAKYGDNTRPLIAFLMTFFTQMKVIKKAMMVMYSEKLVFAFKMFFARNLA